MSRQFIVRSFALQPSPGEGRSIVGRCVPYGEPATVDDGQGPYREMFARGAFRRVTKAPSKVLLDFEHKEDILNALGRGVEFVERDDGLHGTFTAFETPAGDQALAMIADGILSGLSVRALVLGPGRREGDIVVRTACHLDRVALCREPAYAGAVVEALRAASLASEPVVLSELRPARNLELDARLHALGVGVVANANTHDVVSGS